MTRLHAAVESTSPTMPCSIRPARCPANDGHRRSPETCDPAQPEDTGKPQLRPTGHRQTGDQKHLRPVNKAKQQRRYDDERM